MNDVLDQWSYFVSPIYSIKKPEFLTTSKLATSQLIKNYRKDNKIDEIYPILQVDVSSDARMTPLLDYVVNTAWNLLDGQGYDMAGCQTYFTEAWCQEHHKYSSMDYHNHNDSQLIAFYFLDCPEDPPKMTIHDPRPAKLMVNLPEKNTNEITMATSIINFTPEPGTLMFANSWLPHSFTRNASIKPFKMIHMNIGVRPFIDQHVPPAAEII